MNDDNPSRRDASIIDRELHERGAKQGRKPHNAVWRSATGWPGLSEACLMVRKTQ